MERKHLLPSEHNDYLERIGLTEIDRKVYIATLDSGLVTFGEIQQLTKIDDLSQVVESIRDLIDIGLIKKAEGRMPRYYAILPFMRETITIEREFTLALDAMIQSINTNKQTIGESRNNIIESEFPAIIKNLLDSFYKTILSPTLKNFEDLMNQINADTADYLKEIQSFNKEMLEELTLMLKPITDITSKLHTNISKINETLESSIAKYKSDNREINEKILKDGFNKIKIRLDALSDVNSNFGKKVINSINTLDELSNSFKVHNVEFSNSRTGIEKSVQSAITSKVTMLSDIESEKNKLLGKLSQNGTLTQEEVEASFNALSNKVTNFSVDNGDIIQKVKEIEVKSNSIATEVDDIYQQLLLENTNRAAKLRQEMTNLGSELSTILTSLNDNQITEFTVLEESFKENFVNFMSQITLEAEQASAKQVENKNKFEQNYKFMTSKWENKMITLFSRPAKMISPVVDGWIEKIKPVIDDFDKDIGDKFTGLITSLEKFEDQMVATIIERIRFVKVMVESRSADLSSILEFAKSFDYVKSSDTWVVVGLPSISASITDMILRAKSKITIVIPNIDFELLETLRNIRSAISVTFVTDFDVQKDARVISRLKDTGRVVLRSYPKRDLYACLRDSEEIIFGYIRSNEQMVGIRSSTPSVVELLQDRINETVIRNSKVI